MKALSIAYWKNTDPLGDANVFKDLSPVSTGLFLYLEILSHKFVYTFGSYIQATKRVRLYVSRREKYIIVQLIVY